MLQRPGGRRCDRAGDRRLPALGGAPHARPLERALNQLAENLEAIEAELPEDATLSADAGYFSEDNIRITSEHGLDPHIATGRFKHSQPQPPAPRGPVAKNATPKQRKARKPRTKKGRAVHARRKATVEPVFGQLDTVQNGRKLLLRGKQQARAQWRFQCAIHNPLELHRAGGPALIDQGPKPAKGANGSPHRPPTATGRVLRHTAQAPHHWLGAIRNTPMPTLAPLPVTDPGS